MCCNLHCLVHCGEIFREKIQVGWETFHFPMKMYLMQNIYRTGSRNIATFNKETDQVTMRGLDNVGLSKDE